MRWRGSLGGETPEGTNPKSVTGVKQTREALGGGNRQEGEKPWSRNVPGKAKPRVKRTPVAECAVGERTPWEAAGAERLKPAGRTG